MATWIVHLRIADKFLDRMSERAGDDFLIGSVAPDCGWGEKDSFSGFRPPAEITHWTKSGKKNEINAVEFSKEYINKDEMWDKGAFYTGYLVHLLTDIYWGQNVCTPTRLKYKAEYENNPEYLLEIKKDWNGLDFVYLKDNPGFRAYKRFCDVDDIGDFLPYFEKGQLKVQCAYIKNYYKNTIEYEMPGVYLTKERQSELVEKIYTAVVDFLTECGYIE